MIYLSNDHLLSKIKLKHEDLCLSDCTSLSPITMPVRHFYCVRSHLREKSKINKNRIWQTNPHLHQVSLSVFIITFLTYGNCIKFEFVWSSASQTKIECRFSDDWLAWTIENIHVSFPPPPINGLFMHFRTTIHRIKWHPFKNY